MLCGCGMYELDDFGGLPSNNLFCFLKIISFYLCMYMCVCAYECRCPWKQKVGVPYPGEGGTGNCEPLDMSTVT